MSIFNILSNEDVEAHTTKVTCPRCKFRRAIYQLTACACHNTALYCSRCGYESVNRLQQDQDGGLSWMLRITCPAAYMVYGALTVSLNEGDIQEKTEWLQAEIKAGNAGGKKYYISRWNKKTKQVELVAGKYPWD